jgi:hypothetical protein
MAAGVPRVFEVEGWGFEENVRVAPAGLFMVLVRGLGCED